MENKFIILYNDKLEPYYAWVFAEEEQYVINAVMNLYFNKPPMFDVLSDDDTEDYVVN